MPDGSFLCCLLPALLITIASAMKTAIGVHERPAIDSERLTRYNLLSFAVLTATYGALCYLIYYEPNVHSGQPVPWGDIALVVCLPIVLAALYYAHARYMIHAHAPRP